LRVSLTTVQRQLKDYSMSFILFPIDGRLTRLRRKLEAGGHGPSTRSNRGSASQRRLQVFAPISFGANITSAPTSSTIRPFTPVSYMVPAGLFTVPGKRGAMGAGVADIRLENGGGVTRSTSAPRVGRRPGPSPGPFFFGRGEPPRSPFIWGPPDFDKIRGSLPAGLWLGTCMCGI